MKNRHFLIFSLPVILAIIHLKILKYVLLDTQSYLMIHMIHMITNICHCFPYKSIFASQNYKPIIGFRDKYWHKGRGILCHYLSKTKYHCSWAMDQKDKTTTYRMTYLGWYLKTWIFIAIILFANSFQS